MGEGGRWGDSSALETIYRIPPNLADILVGREGEQGWIQHPHCARTQQDQVDVWTARLGELGYRHCRRHNDLLLGLI